MWFRLLVFTGCLITTLSCSRKKPYVLSSKVVVTDFGARPDDKIDDSQAIQRAIDHASSIGVDTVYIPEGTFIISRTKIAGQAYCLTTKTGTVLVGSQKGQSTLKLASNQRNYTRMVYADGVSDVSIHNILFDGSRYSHDQSPRYEHLHGVYINNAHHVTIDNCSFISTRGDGVAIRGPEQPASNILVRHCHFEDNGRNGLTLGSGFDGVTIDSCYFDATTMHASPIDSEPESSDCRDVVIKNCTIDNNKVEATLVTFGGHVPVYNYNVFNNTFNNCQLLFAYSYDSRIYDNKLTTLDKDKAALKFVYSNTGVEVYDNTIEAATKFVEAISTNYGKVDGGVVRYNKVTVSDNGMGYAIKIQGVDNFAITNNEITAAGHSSQSAIYLRTTADMSNLQVKNNVISNFDSYITIQGFKDYIMNASTIDNTLKNVKVVETKYIGSKAILDKMIDPSMIISEVRE